MVLSKASFVKIDGIKSNGYFYDAERTLAVATGKSFDKWFPTLVHEFCHFNQWRSRSSIWHKDTYGINDKSGVVDDYINRKKVNKRTLKKAIRWCIAVEFDCEKRAVKHIDKFNLPLDKETYIQKALAYVLFYHYVEKHRKWYKIGKEPYKLKSVWSKMPKTLKGIDIFDAKWALSLADFSKCV